MNGSDFLTGHFFSTHKKCLDQQWYLLFASNDGRFVPARYNLTPARFRSQLALDRGSTRIVIAESLEVSAALPIRFDVNHHAARGATTNPRPCPSIPVAHRAVQPSTCETLHLKDACLSRSEDHRRAFGKSPRPICGTTVAS